MGLLRRLVREPAAAPRTVAAAALSAVVLVCSGCSNLLGAMASETLSAAILNQDDPALIESGVPAYLLLIDGLISQNPENETLLAAGAQLFALYGSRFAGSEARAADLTWKGRRYGVRAMCGDHEWACEWSGSDYSRYVEQLNGVTRRDIDVLYAFSVSWLSHLDATSEDWSAVAELPWVEASLERVLELDETYEQGAVHGYLGILKSLRPPALGGQPEVAKMHFERAIDLSEGRDLSIKVEYARRYARLVFDQELHDRLLADVLSSEARMPGMTLFNVLAKQDAERLLASSEEYF